MTFIFGGPPNPETQAQMEAERQRQLGAIHANLAPLDAFIERATLEELTMLRGIVNTIIHNPESGHFLVGRIAERARGQYGICTFCNEKHETPEDFLAAHGPDGGVKGVYSADADKGTKVNLPEHVTAETDFIEDVSEPDDEGMREMGSPEYRMEMDGPLPPLAEGTGHTASFQPAELTPEEIAAWEKLGKTPMPNHEDDVDPPTTDGTY